MTKKLIDDFTYNLNLLGKLYPMPNLMEGYFNGQLSRWVENFKIINKYISKEDKILDVGTYPSYSLVAMKKMGYDIYGVDIDPSRENNFPEKEGVDLRKCDIETERMPFENKTFDKVILSEVFEHLYINPIFTFNEIKRVLKDNGHLIITTPNGYSIKRIYNFIIGNGASENPFDEFNKINTIGHRGHIREYSTKEIIDFIEKIGFICYKNYYVSLEHNGLKDKKIFKWIVRLIYIVFPIFRSNIIVVGEKK
jgi:SAM-dependent methyltransferase